MFKAAFRIYLIVPPSVNWAITLYDTFRPYRLTIAITERSTMQTGQNGNPDEEKKRSAQGQPSLHPLLLKAIARGWRLFPVKGRDKTPLIKKWTVAASAAMEQVTAWPQRYPGCNWGLATGPDSGVFVVDVDNEEALRALNRLGKLPRTYTVKTARGRHLYFAYPPNAKVKGSASKLSPGLDVRGDGGFVVFPPSVHPSGAVYSELDSSEPAPAPKWLLKLVCGQPSAAPKASENEGSTSHATAKIGEGRRNSYLTSVAGTMQRKGMSQEAVVEALLKENEQKFDTPLDENEVRAIAKSVGRYEPTDRETGEMRLVLGERPFAQMVPDAEALLRDCAAERIFQMVVSRRLVRIVQNKEVPNPSATERRDPEACLLVDVDISYLRLALGRSGRVFRKFLDKLVPVDAPRLLAELVLSSVSTSPDKASWRRLKKVSVTPILLSDGTIVSKSGYHEQSQMWIDTRGIDFIEIAKSNPRLSARQCHNLIEEFIHPIFCMYPFAREKEGQFWHETGAFGVVLSALMCIDDRHNLPAVPMHCVSAPTQSCGKTRLVESICAAVTRTPPTIVTYDGVEEFAKHLPVLLGKGDSAICLDNIIMAVNNAKLAALLTQEHSFKNRILGKSQDVTIENVSVLFATGVNLQLSGDMPTRCLLARIEPEDERPDQRRFPFNPVDRAKELFPRAVMALKAVVRAHQLHGFPGMKRLEQASRFPIWDMRIRAAIVWAGYSDPLSTQEAIRSDDPVRLENVRVLWILRERFKDESFLTCEISGRMSREPENLEVLKQITGHKENEGINERKIGKYLSHVLAGRWFDGIRLIKTGKNQNGRIEWRIEAKADAVSFGVEEEPL
jgi:hypothetical protein